MEPVEEEKEGSRWILGPKLEAPSVSGPKFTFARLIEWPDERKKTVEVDKRREATRRF